MATHIAIAQEDVPVKWTHSIYAPSYGLDDGRIVTRQSDFSDLYTNWLHPVQFLLYSKRGNTSELVTFMNCGEITHLASNSSNVRWATDLDRLRFWIQVSNCNMWAMMVKLNGSRVSYLPDLIESKGANTSEAISAGVKFADELVKTVVQSKKSVKSKFLSDFELLEGGEIYCGTPTKCSYDVPDDEFETRLISVIAQGDYNGDGVNDYFITIFAPSRKSGYAGLIVTRKKKDGPLEIIGEY
jgi:hypothetical protein